MNADDYSSTIFAIAGFQSVYRQEKKFMKMSKKDILVLVIPFVILAIVYLFLPARIPRQFGFNGKPTSYMAKEFIFLFGILPFLIYKRYSAKHK